MASACRNVVVTLNIYQHEPMQEATNALDYRSRLSFEIGDLILNVESSHEGTHTALKIFRVEAVEHLPSLTGCCATQAAALSEV